MAKLHRNGEWVEVQWIMTPHEKREEILRMFHEDALAGHMGSNKMWERICECFYWCDMAHDIRQWTNGCLTCQSHKPPKPMNPGHLHANRVDTMEPFNKVTIDIFGPFPAMARGNTVVLVMVDYFTKWIEAVPMKDQMAASMADTLYRWWICRHGLF